MVRAERKGVDIRAVDPPGLMDSGTWVLTLGWLLLYWVQLLGGYVLFVGDLIRIFQSLGAMELPESFYNRENASVATSGKPAASQEFDWLAWTYLGGRVAECVELPVSFPISPLRLQRYEQCFP